MMENRSFDHMLGGLKKKHPKIDGLSGDEWNQDANGNIVQVQPNATYQGQLDHDEGTHTLVNVNPSLLGTSGRPSLF